MKNDWNQLTFTTLAHIICENKILLKDKRTLTNDKHMWLEAVKCVSDKMKSLNINILPHEVVRKINLLKSIYSEEILKMKKEPGYEPNIIWFPIIDKIINESRDKKTGKTNPNVSEGESSNQSATRRETGDGLNDVHSEDMPTQINSMIHCCQEQKEALSVLHDEISSLPFPREEQSFQNPNDPTTSINKNNGGMDVCQNETADGIDFPTDGTCDILITFVHYLGSLMRRLPLEKSYQLQQMFIHKAMNASIQFEKERTLFLQRKRNSEVNQIYDREDQSFQNPNDSTTSINKNNGGMDVCQNETSEGIDFPAEEIGDILLRFVNYLGSLMRRLPLDKFYQLQQMFILEATNASIQFEKERTLFLQRKRISELNQMCNRTNGVVPEISIDIEEGPQIGHIKKELETNFEAVDSNGLPSFDSAVVGAPGLEIRSEDNRVICVQCNVCKELFLTSEELKRHHATKHPGMEKTLEPSGNEEGAPKRMRHDDWDLAS